MESYRERQRIYKRREQMAIWVGAGIGGLVAVASAHFLDGRPQIFVQSILTLALLAALAWAYARVQFEWLATEIDRAIEDNLVQKSSPYPKARLNEDERTEILWILALRTMAAGWVLVLIGACWPSKSAIRPCPFCNPAAVAQDTNNIQHFSFPNFAKNDESIEKEDFSAQAEVDKIAAAWKKHRELKLEGVVFVIGSTDRLPLHEKSRFRFDSNVGLAGARAESVARAISDTAKKLTPQTPLPDDRLVKLVSGPLNTPRTNEGAETGFPEDRRVDVWILWTATSTQQLKVRPCNQNESADTAKTDLDARYAVIAVSLLLLMVVAYEIHTLHRQRKATKKADEPQDTAVNEAKSLLRFRMYTEIAPPDQRGIYLEVTNLDATFPAVQLKAFAKLAAPHKEEGVSIFFPPIAEIKPLDKIQIPSPEALDSLLEQYFPGFDPSTAGIGSAGERRPFETFDIELRCAYSSNNSALREVQIVLEEFLNVKPRV